MIFSYPMIRYTDMEENMKKDVMEVCTNACEKHTANNELVRDFFYFVVIITLSQQAPFKFNPCRFSCVEQLKYSPTLVTESVCPSEQSMST